MSKYSDALHALAVAVAPVEAAGAKGTKAIRAKAQDEYAAILSALGKDAGGDLLAVQALHRVYSDEDAHARQWPSLRVWLAACERCGFEVALQQLTAGAELVVLGGRVALKSKSGTKLAPHDR